MQYSARVCVLLSSAALFTAIPLAAPEAGRRDFPWLGNHLGIPQPQDVPVHAAERHATVGR